MADEPVLVNGSPVVDAPVSTPAPEAPAVDYEKQSDEEIIGLDYNAPVEEKTDDEHVEAEPVETKTEPEKKGETAQETKPEGDGIDRDGRKIPEKWRELAKTDKDFKEMFHSERAYREVYPNIAEARTSKEIVSTLGVKTVDDAKAIQAERAEFQQADADFFSGDPVKQEAYLDGLRQMEGGGPALISAFDAAAKILKQHFPNEYQQRMGNTALETLRDAEFDKFAASVDAIVNGNAANRAELLEQIAKNVVTFAKGLGLDKPVDASKTVDPRDAEIARLKKADSDRVARDAETNYRNFETKTDEDVKSSLNLEIDGQLKKLLEKVPDEIKSKAMPVLVEDISAAVDRALKSDKEHNAQFAVDDRGGFKDPVLDSIFKQHGIGKELSAEILKRTQASIKRVLPGIMAPRVNTWTAGVVASNKSKVERQNTAASQRDVGSGGAGIDRPAKPLTAKNIDYRKTSDEDILEGKAAARK